MGTRLVERNTSRRSFARERNCLFYAVAGKKSVNLVRLDGPSLRLCRAVNIPASKRDLDALERPVQGGARDQRRGRHDDEAAIPLPAVIPSHEQKCSANNGQLPGFNAHIESNEGSHKFRTRQPKLFQCTGEAHSMQQTKSE